MEKRVTIYQRVALFWKTDAQGIHLHKAKTVLLHAMKALGGKGGIAPTNSRIRH
jgi:hypothetical protein